MPQTHWFTATFEQNAPIPDDASKGEVDTALEAVANRLYEAGCNDAAIGMVGGVLTAAFARQAASRYEAVASATANIESCGCKVVSIVDDEPL